MHSKRRGHCPVPPHWSCTWMLCFPTTSVVFLARGQEELSCPGLKDFTGVALLKQVLSQVKAQFHTGCREDFNRSTKGIEPQFLPHPAPAVPVPSWELPKAPGTAAVRNYLCLRLHTRHSKWVHVLCGFFLTELHRLPSLGP